MFIVYLYSFINKKKVFVGLSENLNFHLELEKKFFDSIGLEINNITIVYYGSNKKLALDEKKIWLAKTVNINYEFENMISYKFITKSFKDKKFIKEELQVLESNYMELFYKYETLKDNYRNIDEIIETAIQESINEWKDSNLSYTNNNLTKDEFNKFGFNVEGYDKYGFDFEGYDKDGYDLDGYDLNGFDSYGFNREEIHKDDLNK